ncbi:MAG: aminopeptidase [Kiritimatiellae bacterium]|nr:aminopeptidase [Kiritimatiellia bacterium]MDW8458655.1 hypothetical protein [Verrucomicrobiota bacterium]
MSFDLAKLLRDVFDPDGTDRVLVMVDVPRPGDLFDADWQERIKMAGEWRNAFERFGATAAPLLRYPATGGNNADLPEFGEQDGRPVRIHEAIGEATLVVAMTRYSATAPLSAYVRSRANLRAASMPGVLRRMERSALSADYRLVGQRARILAERLDRAEGAIVRFETGHQCFFDLRFRRGHADDGDCTKNKQGFRLINLPSGEAFIVPYEGERPGDPSRTAGEIPIGRDGEIAVLKIAGNRIESIDGGGLAARLRTHFDLDPARRNIAELGLGCNDAAIVAGNVLEDEKAGFHWAYGRSEHLGGVTGPESFQDPSHVLHQDVVYAEGCPIRVDEVNLLYPGGASECIFRNGRYLVW